MYCAWEKFLCNSMSIIAILTFLYILSKYLLSHSCLTFILQYQLAYNLQVFPEYICLLQYTYLLQYAY